ncbi:MAG: hypothetical protein U0324_15675 [Polyangiales bacterium]
MDPAITGAQLHAITRASIVRLPFLILLWLVFGALGAAILSAVHSVTDALMALALFAMAGAWPALFLGLRWATPQLASVHENGLVIRRRGRARFVPWAGVERVAQRVFHVHGVPQVQYVVHVAPKPVVVAESVLGRALMDAIVGTIVDRAGLDWSPEGWGAVRAGWVPPPPTPAQVAAAKRDGLVGLAVVGAVTLLCGALGVYALADALDDSKATVTVEQVVAGPAPTARELTVRGVAALETVVDLNTTGRRSDEARMSHYVPIVAPGWAVGRPVQVIFHTRPSAFNEGAGRLHDQTEFRGLRRDALPDDARRAFTHGGVALADRIVVLEEEIPERSYLAAVVLLGLAGVFLLLFVVSVLPAPKPPAA